MNNGDEPTHDERAELRAIREHVDTEGAGAYSNAMGACHAAANYLTTAKLLPVGQASREDLDKAMWILVGALERVGLRV